MSRLSRRAAPFVVLAVCGALLACATLGCSSPTPAGSTSTGDAGPGAAALHGAREARDARALRESVRRARTLARAPLAGSEALARPSSTRARATLPADARGALRVELPGTKGAYVTIVDAAADASPATPIDGAIVFADAHADADTVLLPLVDGVEEVRVVRALPAPASAGATPLALRERVELGPAIAELRARQGRIEAVDAHGYVLLGTAPVFAVDARGTRRDLEVEVLAASGASGADGASRGERWREVRLSLDVRGLVAPVAIDPAWSALASMNTPRRMAATTLLADGRVFVQGGYDGANTAASAEIYDPTKNTWTSLGDDLPRDGNTATPLPDGRVLIVGGSINGTLTDPVSASYFDPRDGSFAVAPSPPTPIGYLGNHAAITLRSGKILIAGGETDVVVADANLFDPTSKTWSKTGAMRTPRARFAAVLLPDGRVLAAGGYDTLGAAMAAAEIYDPAAGTWTAIGPLASPRRSPSGVLLGNGKALIVGGGGANCPTTGELFDPATSSWLTPEPRKSANADEQTATLLGNGLVLVAGGGDCVSAVLSTELYDPVLDKWTKTADPLSVARFAAGAVRLFDGRVLLVGGSSEENGGSVTATTEAYTPQVVANGVACKIGAECASGFCADGVCCNAACVGECTTCNAPGRAGACSAKSVTTACGAPLCDGATITDGGHCSGLDATCMPFPAVTCPGALVCADAKSCKTGCFADADCTTGTCDLTSHVCTLADGGVLGVVGRACKRDAECAAGHCVDGVCCDSACADKCHHCALPGKLGTCSIEPSGTDLRNECGAGGSCIGTCDGHGGCQGDAAGSQCAPQRCTDATHAAGAAICPSTGATCPVEAVAVTDCLAYGCEPLTGACRASCQSSEDCAPDVSCDITSGHCVAPPPPSAGSGGCSAQGTGLTGAYGAVAALALVLATAARRRRTR